MAAFLHTSQQLCVLFLFSLLLFFNLNSPEFTTASSSSDDKSTWLTFFDFFYVGFLTLKSKFFTIASSSDEVSPDLSLFPVSARTLWI